MKNTTVILILAGGKSKRMGYNKQKIFIKKKNNINYIENMLNKIKLNNIFYNNKKKISHPFFLNDIGNSKSLLTGINTSLQYFLKKTNFQIMYILNIDMPLIIKKTLTTLKNANIAYNGLYYEKKNFPLKLKITKKNLIIIKNLIKKNVYTIKKIIVILQITIIKYKIINDLLFINMNTPKIWYFINKII